MAGDITGANAVIMFAVTGLFPTPVQLQGFAADDVFDTDQLESAEVSMGVDGTLSAGFVYVPVMQSYKLQADSSSISFFDAWWATNQQTRSSFRGQAIILLPAISKKWAMNNGVLSGYTPLPATKKLLQPQGFKVTWESCIPAPTV